MPPVVDGTRGLARVVGRQTKRCSRHAVTRLEAAFDRDRDTSFCSRPPPPSPACCVQADKDGDGTLDLKEFTDIIHKLDASINQIHLMEMFNLAVDCSSCMGLEDHISKVGLGVSYHSAVVSLMPQPHAFAGRCIHLLSLSPTTFFSHLVSSSKSSYLPCLPAGLPACRRAGGLRIRHDALPPPTPVPQATLAQRPPADCARDEVGRARKAACLP